MSSRGRERLLSGEAHNEDATLITARAEEGSDSDPDESYDVDQAPTVADRRILEGEEEEQNLLHQGNRPGAFAKLFKFRDGAESRRRRRNEKRSKRSKKSTEGSGNAELIYEMEGGYKDSSSRSSTESLALKKEKWNQEPSSQKPFGRSIFFAASILTIFFLLAYGSYSASRHRDAAPRFSNGTHTFVPTTVLISLDGFRADFLYRNLTPTLNAFIQSGVSPKYMLPSFPSLTFPNHFTFVTGLHPESHGIVSNHFWDPITREEFISTHTEVSMQPKWWNAEPIWVTAEKQGIKTAIHMWPGSEAHIDDLDPTYLDKYNGSEALNVKVDRILHWLDLPRQQRPQFIGAYVPNVDSDGHLYGPNSTEIRATIVEVDSMLTSLLQGLYQRNLTEVVNLVIVSDHGMATTSNDRVIQLDDLIDMTLIDRLDGWPLRGLRPKNPDRDLPLLHQQLLAASKSQQFDVYTLETMPEKFHYRNNDRIAPLWIVPRAGWIVIEKSDFDLAAAQASGVTYRPKGLHGFDPEDPLMRAIFVARGPAFPHTPNSRVAVFQNIEVYNIICDSLDIEPHLNNGTLRLPLETEGLHSEVDDTIDIPADPFDLSLSIQPSILTTPTDKKFADETIAKTSLLEVATPPAEITSVIGSAAVPTAEPTSTAESGKASSLKNAKSKWLDFLHNKLDQAKDWAKDFVDSFRKDKPSSAQEDPSKWKHKNA